MLVLILFSLFAPLTAFASNPINVVDNLGFLTTDQIEELQAKIDEIKTNYTLDTVIVFTDNTHGKSSHAYADDYYDYNDYGIDDEYSGILMLVNMQDREVWISTTGRAIRIFTDARIEKMVNNVTSSLSNKNYFMACNIFIDDVINYTKAGVPSNQYSVDRDPSLNYYNPSYKQKVGRMVKSVYVYIIALVVSLLATFIVTRSSKGDVTISNKTYEEGGSFVLNQNTDQYLTEKTTRTKIQSESSGGSSGRSSTHRGSSGRSHGGGGGRF